MRRVVSWVATYSETPASVEAASMVIIGEHEKSCPMCARPWGPHEARSAVVLKLYGITCSVRFTTSVGPWIYLTRATYSVKACIAEAKEREYPWERWLRSTTGMCILNRAWWDYWWTLLVFGTMYLRPKWFPKWVFVIMSINHPSASNEGRQAWI